LGVFLCKALSVSAYSVINSAYIAEWNTKIDAESKALTVTVLEMRTYIFI